MNEIIQMQCHSFLKHQTPSPQLVSGKKIPDSGILFPHLKNDTP
jgi:hypothetical protein